VNRASKAKLDPKDLKVKLALQVLQVRLVRQEPQAKLDHRANRDHKDYPPKVD
jgi:HSP20 family molecular chaperone IbpA